MSLIRQVWALLALVLVLALAGAVGVNLWSAREVLQSQLRLKNGDNARSLALVLSQQHGDPALIGLAIASQFDTGDYRRIRLVAPDGQTALERERDSAPARAPAWFAALLPIASEPGIAQVADGWRSIGRLEVQSHAAYAHDELWRGGLLAAAVMAAIAFAAALLAAVLVRRIAAPLEATVEQARSLVEGRYVIVDEPAVPELKRVAAAMNAMVERVRSLFESQAAQTEALRLQAHCEPLTGLPHRTHFMGLLGGALQREDVDGGGLVLVRLAELGKLNRNLGRPATDAALKAIARVLRAYPERVAGCFVGRLNGSDFALCLPSSGVAAETAEAVGSALGRSLPAFGIGIEVHIGAAEWRSGADAGSAMAQADLALARAEARGAFAVETIVFTGAESVAAPGEGAWRAQVLDALADGRNRLAAFPVIDRQVQLVHLESPMRLQLTQGGAWETATAWLPLAARNRLTAQVDARAVRLALEAIAADGRPRGVNVAPASLGEGGFAPQIQHLLQERPQAARGLWIEVAESAATDHFDLLQAFGRTVRPLGVRFGLEHAGERLARIERLYELGLDFVKLDAAVCSGVARSPAGQAFMLSTVALLHALGVQVLAEGLVDEGDVAALWGCGVDGVTGPWASLRWTG